MATKQRRVKDFGSDLTVDDFEPLAFTLCGQEFNCRPAIQGSELIDLIVKSTADGGSNAAGASYAFFEVALYPDDYKRFIELLHDDKQIITVNKLSEITAWLVEEYTARPTEQPSPSSDGPSISGLE